MGASDGGILVGLVVEMVVVVVALMLFVGVALLLNVN